VLRDEKKRTRQEECKKEKEDRKQEKKTVKVEKMKERETLVPPPGKRGKTTGKGRVPRKKGRDDSDERTNAKEEKG